MSTVMMSPDDRHVAGSVLGGTAIEIIGGVSAVVLTILGLSHVAPGSMLAIATIALGVAFVFEGGGSTLTQ